MPSRKFIRTTRDMMLVILVTVAVFGLLIMK